MPPLSHFHPQEKLQKCLEPLEQKLQEITRCKSSEEKKPGELKVKAGDSIWAALQAVNHALFNPPGLIHSKNAVLSKIMVFY